MIGVIFMFLMIVSFFFCGFFITCRLDCNRCGGNFQKIKNIKQAQKQMLLTMIVLVGFYVAGSIVVSVFNYFAFKGIYDTVNNFENEVRNLEISYTELTRTIYELGLSDYGNTIYKGLTVIANFYDIKKEITAISEQSISFSDSAYSYEVILFSWIWLQLFFTLICVAIVISGSKTKKSNLMVIVGSVLLYVFLVTHLAYLACLSSEIFMTADICEQVYSVVTFNSVPNVELGLAYYFKPFSYEAIGNILAQSYLVGAAYDAVMGLAKFDLVKENRGECVDLEYNTREEYEKAIAVYPTCFPITTALKLNRDALQKLSVVMSQLYDMRYYRNLRKFSQDSEWPLCVRTLNAFPFRFYGMIFCTFFLLLITITATKIITVTNKRIYENLTNV